MAAMQTLRTSVPPAVFAELDHRAEKAGLTLAAYLRVVLTDHVADEEVTPTKWGHFAAWVKEHPEVMRQYTGSRKWGDPAARTAVYRWAAEHHGYIPG